ncbi:Oxysterol-binding protein 1 [Nymphon striatum]|nr:Oxysterol-binding protein 1 [Nymphon striatum]
MTDTKQTNEPDMKGFLFKWTNYLKGYQKRWFVLSNGILSYYRSQAEMAHTCRGTISLQGAFIHTEDSCNFVITNGGTQTFHLKANSEVERQRWVTALELAKAKAIRIMESEDEDYEQMPNEPDKNELQGILKVLRSKLEDLSTCNDLILKQGSALQRSLSELEQHDSTAELSTKVKTVNERATLFRVTSNAMINIANMKKRLENNSAMKEGKNLGSSEACSEYLYYATTQGRKWIKMLQHEHEQRLRLEDMVEQLARQHSNLEQAAKEASVNPNSITAVAAALASSHGAAQSEEEDENENENEFFDAEEGTEADFIVTLPHKGHRRSASGLSSTSIGSEGAGIMDNGSLSTSDSEGEDSGQKAGVITRKKLSSVSDDERMRNEAASPGTPPKYSNASNSDKPKRKRRLVISEKPNYSLNLWSIMKNCIGKELTKIPMPVNFNEPLSTLQRLTEEYEYADLLHRAARCEDSCEQLAWVAAYTVSAYATTSNRSTKPFNPLLGETFEFDRMDDLGWRALSEQVSHHPPMLAQYCESGEWKLWQEFTMSSKFRGKYLQIIPLGIAHLEFEKSGNHYTWRKVNTTVHNIIVGKLWVDHHGEMDIMNHKTGDKCHLRFIPYSYFSRDIPRKVTGVVANKDGVAKWVLSGTWDAKIEAARVIGSHGSVKGKPILETTTPRTLWRRIMPNSDYEKMYNFTQFACQMNEMEENVCITDSRLRPDQRLMEIGKWDEANHHKVRLEEKQRAVRRQREQEAELAAQEGRPYPGYEPLWFKKQKEKWTGNPIHTYTGKYWDCKTRSDWSKCPDIF